MSGHRRVPMKDLRVLFADLGFPNVETYLQSGNVVFGPSGSSGDPASRVSSAIKETFGHEVEVLVFSGPAFNEIASANPILERSGRDESFLHVTFLFNSDVSPIPDELALKLVFEFGILSKSGFRNFMATFRIFPPTRNFAGREKYRSYRSLSKVIDLCSISDAIDNKFR